MAPGPTATAAVLRLARHATAFQNDKSGEPSDALAILHFIERSLTAGSLPRSAAWLPEIVELGASLGSPRLLLELQAAVVELLAKPWEETREIFEDLLFRLRTSLPPPERERALLVLFRSLREIPDTESRRERTLQLLPLLAAAAEQLPGKLIRRVFRRAGQSALREAPSPSPEGFTAQICAADPALRIEAAKVFAQGQNELAPGAPFHALALLVSQAAPETSVALVLRTLPDSLRDEACRRLIRYGWLPPLQARELLAVITQSVPALEAGLFLEEGADPWLRSLARLAASHGFEPSAPESSPILERLWRIAPPLSRPCLADAVVTALRSGPEEAERAIRLWLHAHLPPRLGAGKAERQKESEEAAGALREALTLAAPAAEQQPVVLPDSTPSPAELGRMAGWLRRRNHTTTQTFLWALRREETWALPHALLAPAILFVLIDFERSFEVTEAWSWPSLLLVLPFRLLVWTHTSPGWLAVLAVFPLNALLLHRILEQETPREDLRSWILKLRFLLGGLPLFGLYMIPAWRRILKSRPSWAFRNTREQILDGSRARPSVSRRSLPATGSWLDRLRSSPRVLIFWLWI
ncbi:MAG TPA: hypothetical protein VLQ45_21160, partial [Thermoanaerobaculia bacterium]|nr:hypothetical protein [Thermoanaerobaculia bacterium]